jgi:UDP-N-acetylmuramoyl-tripeptide--D-alanyl-D-alanine ligase
MPLKIRLDELSKILDGKLILKGDLFAPESLIEFLPSVDSRVIEEGEIFVCIKGKHIDGHNFAQQSLNRNAIGLITEQELDLDCDKSYFEIVVHKADYALKKIGRYILKKINPIQICITGSSGKTTVKELVYSILSVKFSTSKTMGNFNTPIGIPLSLSRIDEKSKYFIAELSASYPGEMDENLSIVNPDIGIITGIGESHLEFFSSIENVFEEKIKLAKALREKGILLANADNYWAKASLNFAFFGYSYGISNMANIRAKDINFLSNSSNFNVSINGRELEGFEIKAIGEHFVLDSLPSIYLGFHLGLTIPQIKEGLLNFNPLPGRGRIIKLKNGAIILDDSYNANPYSFEASIKAFIRIPKRRAIIVMGDMLELGSSSLELHKKVGKLINDASIDMVLYIGKYGEFVREELGYKTEFLQFVDIKDILFYLRKNFSCGDAILIKGSNDMNLKSIVEELENC